MCRTALWRLRCSFHTTSNYPGHTHSRNRARSNFCDLFILFQWQKPFLFANTWTPDSPLCVKDIQIYLPAEPPSAICTAPIVHDCTVLIQKHSAIRPEKLSFKIFKQLGYICIGHGSFMSCCCFSFCLEFIFCFLFLVAECKLSTSGNWLVRINCRKIDETLQSLFNQRDGPSLSVVQWIQFWYWFYWMVCFNFVQSIAVKWTAAGKFAVHTWFKRWTKWTKQSHLSSKFLLP